MNAAIKLSRMSTVNGWARRIAYQVVGNRSWTHGEVHDLVARAAGVLAARGVAPGDRLLMALPDGIGWIVTFLAAARSGAVAVPANPALSPAEHAALVTDSDPAFVIGPAELAGRFATGPWIDVDELLAAAQTAAAAGAVPVADSERFCIQYTSGTTGQPKGAVPRHGDFAWHQRVVGRDMLRICPDDVSMSISKLYFAYGFGNSFIYPLHTGSSAVLLPGAPAPELVTEAVDRYRVDRYRVSILHAVPSAYADLIACADPAAFGTLRVAVSAGERLRGQLGEQAGRLLGVPILDELGSTEVGGAFCANSLGRNVSGTAVLQDGRLRTGDCPATGRRAIPGSIPNRQRKSCRASAAN